MILFGISNCDTVRKAKKFLENAQIDYQFHDFRKDGLTPSHIEKWLKTVSMSDLVNKRSTAWRTLDEEQKALLSSDDDTLEALELLCKIPTLIKRPLLEKCDQILLGFKESDYQNLL